MKTKVIGYVRVSTEQQADSGLGLEDQRQRITAYAAAMGLDLLEIIEDAGVSAGTLARPGLRQALESLENGSADGIVIAKLDRLTRSLPDFAVLIKTYFQKKYRLFSVADSIDTKSASGRMFLKMTVMFSEWEREVISERTRDALQALKRRGVKLGRKPVDTLTAVRIAALRELGLSYRAIAVRMAEDGFPTAQGGVWAAETVRGIAARAA